MPWATQGILQSPTAGTLLADTGALLAATFSLTILVTTQYSARVTIARRNALNDTDLSTHLVKTVSDAPTMLNGMGSIALLLNERIVVRAESAMIGEVQASILW